MTRTGFTVIIPNCNDGDYLERALCSVLDQGVAGVQTIVVDGGSSDDSLAVTQQYRDEISEVICEPTRNLADAINRGLARATGQWIAIVPSNGLLLPGVLHAVAQRAAQSDAPAWIVGSAMRIDAHDRSLGRIHGSAPSSLVAHLMHDSGVLPISSSFFRHDVLAQVGPLDESLQYAHQYDLHARLLAHGHRPAVVSQTWSCLRETERRHTARQTLECGLEFIEVARRYHDRLPLACRYTLWANCDRRRRIYALAEAELQGHEAQRFLLQQFVRRPWWLTDEHFRQALMHGIDHPTFERERHVRPAA
jgi:glycosyltransferase involved in cell wall biosynthesis